MVQSLLVACCLAVAVHQTLRLMITQSYGKTLESEVKIQIEQLSPFQIIELEAKAIDQKGEIWTSHAFFQANKEGLIDIENQKPLQGSSYETVDGMGLFWSMLPPSKDLSSSYKCREGRFSVELIMGGTRAADAKASRDSWKKITSFFQETLKPTEANYMKESNQEKFSALRKFKLPNDQYAITGSGPLGIRNLKTIGDIDIIVTPQLWDILAKRYGIVDENGVKKITFPGGIVEAFGDDSFYTYPKDDQAPTIASRIAKAEIIEELPFDSMENVLYYKRKDAREKDLKDIILIEQWIKMQKQPK